MTCCNTLLSIARDCDSNVGGIRKAWIACYNEITKIDVQEQEDDEIYNSKDDEKYKKIIAITAAQNAWKEFQFRKQTGSVTTTITKDDATGTLYYESAITLQFTKQETQKREAINNLAFSDIAVIIEDNNGRQWFFGKDFPVSLTEGTAETGTALSDLNGYNITLTDLSKELPYEIHKNIRL